MIRGAILVAGAACAWGTWSLFLRPVALPAAWSSFLVFAFVALGALPLFRADGEPRWNATAYAMLGAFALSDAINVGAFFYAMSVTSVAVAVLTHSFAPMFVALAAPFIDGQRVRGAAIAAIVAISGIGLILRPWEPDALAGDVGIGAAFGLLSALAYAANVFLARRLTIAIGAARTMGLHAFGAALLLLPLALITPADIEPRGVGIIAFAAVLLGVIANIAFVRGLVVIGSARTSVLALLEPLVACLVGWLVWNESLDESALIGAALILGAGIFVANSGNAEPQGLDGTG